MADDLHLRGYTADCNPSNGTLPGEVLHPEDETFLVVPLGEAVSSSVYLYHMSIDLPTFSVLQDEGRRNFFPRRVYHPVVLRPKLIKLKTIEGEEIEHLDYIIQEHNNVEVFVGASFFSKEGIDSPSTGHPDLDVMGLETFQYAEGVFNADHSYESLNLVIPLVCPIYGRIFVAD